jgi:ATP/maltotriose-dependent transcriptional regulator MalT
VLRSNPEVDAFLARLAATDRPVPDFLVEELLAALPASDRDILTAASLDETLDGNLDTVLPDRTDAGPVLDRFASEMGLITTDIEAGDPDLGLEPIQRLASIHTRAVRSG